MKVGEADTLRIMMRDAGLDPKEGASAEDLTGLGFTPADGPDAWYADGLTVFLDEDGLLQDIADR